MIGQVIRLMLLVMVGALALVVVRTREPAKQAIGVSAFALVVAALMAAYAAPDVALSQIVAGAVIEPLLIVFTLAKIRRREEGR